MATEAVGEKENGDGRNLKNSSSDEREQAITRDCALFREVNHESSKRKQQFCSCE